MYSWIFYFGFFYLLVGILFLFVPLIYLELGKPNDLIKAFLNLLVGFVFIIKNRSLDESFFIVLLLLTLLVGFYITELFLSRWNQLTDKEKKKLTTFLEFKNNLSKIFKAINLGAGNFVKPLNLFNFDSKKPKISQKKWVRNDKNDNIKVLD